MNRLLSASFLTIIFVAISLAQTPTGRLLGVISGPDGVLPNATVTVTFNQTGKSQTIVTDGDGAFSLAQLEPGLYTVNVTASGFKTLVANEVKIDIGRDYNLTRALEVGSVQESVTVTAGADVLTSTSAQVTNTVSPQQILSLPLITRNPLNLTTLQAGTASNPNQGTSINGMRTSMTNITRDGISINDPFIRANATDFAPGRPSVDDTGEFTISTSNQEADLGSGGAQIILVTPRGQKSFHGALFAYNRNSRFAANDFFNNSTVNQDGSQSEAAKKPGFRNRNQYGGKVSGPFLTPHFGEGGHVFDKNKGFFFFAYEGIKDPLALPATRTILTPAARTGAFSYTRATSGNAISSGGVTCAAAAGSTCTITNILAFAQAQGFQGIPSTIDPVIQARVLSVLPAAGNAAGGDGLNTTGYSLNRRFDTARNTYTTRIDVDASDKDSVSGIFSYNKENVLRPDVDITGFSTSPDVTQFSANKQFTISYRRVIGSSMVNEVRYGFFSNVVPFHRISAYPSFFLGPSGTTSTTLAGIISQPDNIFLDQGRNNKVFTLADNFNLELGKHSLKFGGQLQKYKVNSFNDVLTVPNYIIGTTNLGTPATNTTFTTNNFANIGGINSSQLTTANGLLAILAGLVNGSTQGFNTSSPTSGYAPVRNLAPYRNSNHAAYVSDRWAITRGLTLTLGVRYELYPALKLANGLALEPVISDPSNPAASLLAGNGTFDVIGTNAGKKFLYYKTDYNNFAPSFGVAYSPRFESGIGKFLLGSEGKTVIRGGYSQLYANDSIITSLSNTLSTNVGLGRASNSALGATGTTLLDARVGSLPAIPTPGFISPPRSFLQNNTAGQGFFGTANVVDPKLQIPKTEQYSVGFQREFFGNTAFEIRYVGSRSHNLTRGIDLNQIDIKGNGFLADFQRAQQNLLVNIAERGRQISNCAGNAACIAAVNTNLPQSAAYNNALSGSTPLTVIPLLGTLSGVRGGIGTAGVGSAINTTVLTNLQNGAAADLAQFYVSQGANNHPTLASPGNVPFVKFYQNPNIGQVELFTNNGFYYYNSLQLEVRRRFSQGLYLQANYTYSKNLTNAIGTSQGLFEPFLQNQDQALDVQRADFDQTHVFNFNGIYQLPFGRGKMFLNQGGIVNKIFGGFELSGLLQTASGSPITFVDTRGTLNRGSASAAAQQRSGRQTAYSSLNNGQLSALGGVYRPSTGGVYYINPSVINSSGRAANGYIYPNTITVTNNAGQQLTFGLNNNAATDGQVFFNVAPGQTGNVRRAIINGPRQFNTNVALLKNISFTETIRVQLRAEAFNVFNSVNFFTGQVNNINSASFGQITSTVSDSARKLQFAVRFEF